MWVVRRQIRSYIFSNSILSSVSNSHSLHYNVVDQKKQMMNLNIEQNCTLSIFILSILINFFLIPSKTAKILNAYTATVLLNYSYEIKLKNKGITV